MGTGAADDYLPLQNKGTAEDDRLGKATGHQRLNVRRRGNVEDWENVPRIIEEQRHTQTHTYN